MSSSDFAGWGQVANVKQLWRASLLFRRMTAVTVFVVVASLVYLGSHIPRAIQLPADDLNKRSTARIGEEQIVIAKPEIAPGAFALSYVGSRNEVAGIWLENATLDEQSQRLLVPHSVVPAPARIGYTNGSAQGPAGSGDTCHTTIEIRRATSSGPIESLKLYQTDATAGAQRFRQIVLDGGASTMAIEVHTDSPAEGPMGFASCHKQLTIGDNPPIDLPPIPVHMLVHGGSIDLHFNPANPALPIWTGPDQTFEAVSLGDGTLRGSGLRIVSTQHSTTAQLEVRTFHATDGITFSRLKLGSDTLKLDIGRDTEKALVYANGSSMYNYDLMDAIQKNLFLSLALTAALGAVLRKWIGENFFPESEQPKPQSPANAAAVAGPRKPRGRGSRHRSRGMLP